MSSQSNDIKQLFSHLGLNPRDYLEIRPKPVSNATVARSSVLLPAGLVDLRLRAEPQAAPEPAQQATPEVVAPAAPRPKISIVDTQPAPVAQVEPVTTDYTTRPEPTLLAASSAAQASEEQLRTVTVNVSPVMGQASAQNLHSLFEQVKEPSTAESADDEEDLSRVQKLQEVIAETRYVPPSVTARRPPLEDLQVNQALDDALARLKNVPPRLQTPPLLAQTLSQSEVGSSLQGIFRRLSKGSAT